MMNKRLFIWILKTALLTALVDGCFACADQGEEAVLLAADPPSISQGTIMTVRLTALDGFFKGKIKQLPLKSDGGLSISDLKILDKHNALATIETSTSTEMGRHLFELEMDGKVGLLTLSVIAPEVAAGEVSLAQNFATQGATDASFYVYGVGTSFGSLTSVEVKGADGFEIHRIEVRDRGQIRVEYSIADDQQPTIADIVVVDHENEYTLPFNILPLKEYKNQLHGQFLTKGQVGTIRFGHPEADISKKTVFFINETDLETGNVEIGDDESASVRARVPFDYDGNSINVSARLYTGGGSFLEIVNIDIALEEPAFVAGRPSTIPTESGDYEISVISKGLDLRSVDEVTFDEQSGVILNDFQATSADSGVLRITTMPQAYEGPVPLLFISGMRRIPGILAITNGSGAIGYSAIAEVSRGDRLYLPIVAHRHNPSDESFRVVATDDIKIIQVVAIDARSLVVDVEIKSDAHLGLNYLQLSGEGFNYEIPIHIVDAGI